MPTPSPESSTAPALPLRLLLPASSCCSPDRAPFRRRVHDLDLDPALAACVQLSLAGPRPAPDSPSAPPPMTLSAFGMNLHAATTADGKKRSSPSLCSSYAPSVTRQWR